MERRQRVRAWRVISGAGAIAILALAAGAGASDERGQVGEAGVQAAVDDAGGGVAHPAAAHPGAEVGHPAEDQPRQPGTRYQDGPGQIPFEQLSPHVRGGVMQADEWVQVHHGDAVHRAWSAYTRARAAEARIAKAAYQSGTNGLEELGVEP